MREENRPVNRTLDTRPCAPRPTQFKVHSIMWYPIMPHSGNNRTPETSGQSSRLIPRMLACTLLVGTGLSLSGCVYYEPVPPPRPHPVYYYQTAPVIVPYAPVYRNPYGYGYR